MHKRYWGRHLWARGHFCATVGAVDEETIKRYIENQRWDEDEEGFKITAPAKPRADSEPGRLRLPQPQAEFQSEQNPPP